MGFITWIFPLCVLITWMISPVWFAFYGFGSISNLLPRFPQYVFNLEGDKCFSSRDFLFLWYYIIPLSSNFLFTYFRVLYCSLCSSGTIRVVLLWVFYFKFSFSVTIFTVFPAKKYFQLMHFLAPNFSSIGLI